MWPNQSELKFVDQICSKVKDRFSEWVALGAVDVEDYIVGHFKEPDDWERNFKASKARGQVSFSNAVENEKKLSFS